MSLYRNDKKPWYDDGVEYCDIAADFVQASDFDISKSPYFEISSDNERSQFRYVEILGLVVIWTHVVKGLTVKPQASRLTLNVDSLTFAMPYAFTDSFLKRKSTLDTQYSTLDTQYSTVTLCAEIWCKCKKKGRTEFGQKTRSTANEHLYLPMGVLTGVPTSTCIYLRVFSKVFLPALVQVISPVFLPVAWLVLHPYFIPSSTFTLFEKATFKKVQLIYDGQT